MWFRCFGGIHLGNSHAARIRKVFSYALFCIAVTKLIFISMVYFPCLKYLLSHDSEFLKTKMRELLTSIPRLHWDFILCLLYLGAVGIMDCNSVQQVWYYLIRGTFIINFSTQNAQMHIICPSAYLKFCCLLFLKNIFLSQIEEQWI